MQSRSLEADHLQNDGDRHSIEDLIEVYHINEAVADPTPRAIAIVDDMLTVGRHFRAMEHVLSERFPGVPLIGVFIARRIFPSAASDFEDVE